jgi:hypothetical protein
MTSPRLIRARVPTLGLLLASGVVALELASASTAELDRSASATRPAHAVRPTRAAKVTAYVMLADGRLAKASLARRRLIAVRRFRKHGEISPWIGRYLAFSNDLRSLYVLLPRVQGRRQALMLVDRRTLTARRRVDLPPEIEFRGIAVGRKTGRIYLIGSRPAEPTPAAGTTSVVASVPRAGSWNISPEAVRIGNGHNWWPWDLALSQDERYLYMSYHGACIPGSGASCTSGADALTIANEAFANCENDSSITSGCLPRVHGAVIAYRDGIIATSGEGPLLEITPRGDIVRTWDARLPGNHIMEAALDRGERYLSVIGSCAYRGGLAVVDRTTGRTRVIAPPTSGGRRPIICGERIVIARDGTAVIARSPTPRASGSPASLAVVAGKTFRRTTIPLPAEALDVIIEG